MKNTVLTIVAIFAWTVNYAQIINPSTGSSSSLDIVQNTENTYSVQVDSFDVNCHTDFFTVNAQGNIQQWSLVDNAVTGGEIIASGAGSSLAFCGDADSPTFYSGQSPNDGIKYYDNSNNNWVNVSLDARLSNNGGHLNNQYYLSAILDQDLGYFVNKVLYHYDGTNLSLIDSLPSTYFSVFDLAVDTWGQAWVFEGNSVANTNQLNVYDNLGMINSYDISFNSTGTYGAFFLNDTLYVGVSPDNSITPIILNGNTAQLGTPIPFINNSFYDMASCQGDICTPNTGIDVINSCDAYTWIDGNTYTESNSSASYTLINSNGCDSIVTLDLSIFSSDISITNNAPVLTSNADSGNYQWLDCDNNFAVLVGETNQSFTATENGTYALRIEQNNCVDTSECILIDMIISTLTHQAKELAVTIYPNPTNDQVQINLGAKYRKVKIMTRNTLGQSISSSTYDSIQKVKFDIIGGSGIYFLEITTEDRPLGVFKVLKE